MHQINPFFQNSHMAQQSQMNPFMNPMMDPSMQYMQPQFFNDGFQPAPYQIRALQNGMHYELANAMPGTATDVAGIDKTLRMLYGSRPTTSYIHPPGYNSRFNTRGFASHLDHYFRMQQMQQQMMQAQQQNPQTQQAETKNTEVKDSSKKPQDIVKDLEATLKLNKINDRLADIKSNLDDLKDKQEAYIEVSKEIETNDKEAKAATELKSILEKLKSTEYPYYAYGTYFDARKDPTNKLVYWSNSKGDRVEMKDETDQEKYIADIKERLEAISDTEVYKNLDDKDLKATLEYIKTKSWKDISYAVRHVTEAKKDSSGAVKPDFSMEKINLQQIAKAAINSKDIEKFKEEIKKNILPTAKDINTTKFNASITESLKTLENKPAELATEKTSLENKLTRKKDSLEKELESSSRNQERLTDSIKYSLEKIEKELKKAEKIEDTKEKEITLKYLNSLKDRIESLAKDDDIENLENSLDNLKGIDWTDEERLDDLKKVTKNLENNIKNSIKPGSIDTVPISEDLSNLGNIFLGLVSKQVSLNNLHKKIEAEKDPKDKAELQKRFDEKKIKILEDAENAYEIAKGGTESLTRAIKYINQNIDRLEKDSANPNAKKALEMQKNLLEALEEIKSNDYLDDISEQLEEWLEDEDQKWYDSDHTTIDELKEDKLDKSLDLIRSVFKS